MKVNFRRICINIPNWKWRELRFGLEKSIIEKKDIILYANWILSEDTEQFDKVIELAIAEEDEVENILSSLVLEEQVQNLENIYLKWMFAIISDAYFNLEDEVYDVIDDVYTEFDYPQEISGLVSYMPCNDNRPMNVKLDEYIENNKNVWRV